MSPANWIQGVTAISLKISRSWAPRLQNSGNQWAKKWGPTCDRNISNSAIYTTAIYRAYTVSMLGMSFEITNFRIQQHLPGANELIQNHVIVNMLTLVLHDYLLGSYVVINSDKGLSPILDRYVLKIYIYMMYHSDGVIECFCCSHHLAWARYRLP